jgi:hypothetical protein
MTQSKLKAGLSIALSFGLLASTAFASDLGLTPVPSANPKAVGVASPNVLPPELDETPVAQGSFKVENPSILTNYYGYDNNGPMVPAPGDLPTASHQVEATKTEPDKNTYLVLSDQQGADPTYDYGTHFLFQGHELGTGGYITRINLDADGPHRVTLLATTDVNGKALPTIDGSTWYPFSEKLLFTSESGSNASILQASLDYPSAVEDISGILGRGGYEGVQADRLGRIFIVEDVGGKAGTTNSHAKQPNSFIYRFIPHHSFDLKLGGKLQVLQVLSKAHPGPIVFGSSPDADIKSQDTKDLRTYGLSFRTNWVTIHDTAVQGTATFDANAAAKLAGGTPFKRPENGQFRPGTDFSEFIFDETGDTNLLSEAGAEYGAFTAVFRLKVSAGDAGRLSLVYRGDAAHAGFDNCAFWDADHIVFVEDAGDTLHTQRNALDSAYVIDLNADYSDPTVQPDRILAEGRDASATIDSGFSGTTGFQNEGDNEITGWHQSDGDPTVNGLLGAKIPKPFRNGWRVFYTQQHGDNFTWEILKSDLDPGADLGRRGRGRNR